MLVLGRLLDESIVLCDSSLPGSPVVAEVMVCEFRQQRDGLQAKLGVTAPPHILIDRKEVYEAKQAENRRETESGIGE